MEVSAPVTKQVITVTQGRKKTDLEFTTRAECRALIAALALAAEKLPDDGEGGVLFLVGDEADDRESGEDATDTVKASAEAGPGDGCPSCGKTVSHAPSCGRNAQLAELGKRVTALSTAPAARKTWGDIFRANAAHPASDARLADRAPVPVQSALQKPAPVVRVIDDETDDQAMTRVTSLVAARASKPRDGVIMVGDINGSETFSCCATPMPWPAKGLDVTCPDCKSVWEREPVDIGAGARLKVLVIDGQVIPRDEPEDVTA